MELNWEVRVSLKKRGGYDPVAIAVFSNKARADYYADSLKKGYDVVEVHPYAEESYPVTTTMGGF